MIDLRPKTVPIGSGNKCCAHLNGAFTELTLREQLGVDGAEGRVFRAEASSKLNYAVKIYHDEYRQPRMQKLFAKLQYLVLAHEIFSKSREPFFAWPLATVHMGVSPSDLIGEKFVGVAMPLLPKMRDFYSIIRQSRKHNLPTLTERIAVAFFLAKGFRMLHEGGFLATPAGQNRIVLAIGDVNDSNIRVTDENVVCFFDCDSYLVELGTQRFGQWTSTETYSSPEFLAAKQRNSYHRTAKDDEFGLAVLIFRLLNNWELPYVYNGSAGLSKSALILEGRFPYGDNSKDNVLPGSETVLNEYRSEIHPQMKVLFTRAFTKGMQRPTAVEWCNGLQEFLLSRTDLKLRREAKVALPPPPRLPPSAPVSLTNLTLQKPRPQAYIQPMIQSRPPPPTESGYGWAIFVVMVLVLLVIAAMALVR